MSEKDILQEHIDNTNQKHTCDFSNTRIGHICIVLKSEAFAKSVFCCIVLLRNWYVLHSAFKKNPFKTVQQVASFPMFHMNDEEARITEDHFDETEDDLWDCSNEVLFSKSFNSYNGLEI